MAGFLSKLLSLGADKDIKRYEQNATRINELEPMYQAMSDIELKAMTATLRERLDAGETLDAIMLDAFAVIREASKRSLGMRHFDVQLIGGMALHEGAIAEMKTGEGKTLVSTLAGYLNALQQRGVHIVTVNDYLAKRDSEWMGQVYNFMGMDVGILQNGMMSHEKKKSYLADVTYGTNSEFGFDYLRDNMVTRVDNRVQRGHTYAIVDEVDSILIDEARTPLIISGAGTKSADTYQKFAKAVKGLREGLDFEMEEAKHTIAATEPGLARIESKLGIDNIYADPSGLLVNHLQQALKAEYMFKLDVNYVIQNGEVKIVDEFTGRIMEGRRYSEGLHQALEAKEGVLVQEENQTLATITLQNYFRLYEKLAGMTGTAMTEDAEFRDIYKLRVQAIPSNQPVVRIDNNDLVYRNVETKFAAVAQDVEERHRNGQPILVGTVTIESSERLSRLLDKRGIPHEVLNAKHHEREASIVAQAGRPGAVTIATNMAGRGTDIILGGNAEGLAEELAYLRFDNPDELSAEQEKSLLLEAKDIVAQDRKRVLDAGGLMVIGTERHESRRIDNQLRGRSGRQGDPGETQFYLSLEDDLMRLFAGDRMDKIGEFMQRAQLPDDMPIKSKQVSRAIEGSQQKVETLNFSARKNVLEYDDVMNQQRLVIYGERNQVLDGKDIHERVAQLLYEVVDSGISLFIPDRAPLDEWDYDGMQGWVEELTGRTDFDIDDIEFDDKQELIDEVHEYVRDIYEGKEEEIGTEVLRELEAQVMLRVIDTRWMNHLSEMDYLKAGIGLRGFGQRDPLVEYKQEAFNAFGLLVDTMFEDFVRTILRLELAQVPTQPEQDFSKGASYTGPAEVDGDRGQASFLSQAQAQQQGRNLGPQTLQPTEAKTKTYRKDEDPNPYVGVGRNDQCPCGSGKKFKNCHGRNA